jgi:hypothetical protein
MTIRVAALVIVLCARVAVGACVDAEPWSGTIGTRAVTCCARHGTQPKGNPYYLDDVTLWCSRARVRSITVDAWSADVFCSQRIVAPGPIYSPMETDRACRIGPRFRRPRSFKPPIITPFRRQHGCCQVIVTNLDGMFDPRGGFGTITRITGEADCRRVIVPFTLTRG